MSAWKPGDVAMIRVGTGDWEVGLHQDNGSWACRHAANRRDWETVEFIRPLVVIDPEDRKQVDGVTDALEKHFGIPQSSDRDTDIDDMQAALRSLLAPPKPDEPTGLGAVVEAINDNRFIRVGAAGWVHEEDCSGEPCDWRDIAAVRVLSVGVAE